ncbi:3'-5' exonuclease [Pelomonas sp. Root1237]|uniref:3'-5' exonuclease n=1 Tax=Pelomonas sp. Root1237 TaxID=1736434 RepID=UPI0006FD1266|nr:3'-5' exonuclease [Pelomonas sp. Root1237]KQV96664.1 DNA polymerase III subunit epsilon [Pelomonas sp. Root1237]
MTNKTEIFLSIDVETSGPIPGEYSMLTLGACNVDYPNQTFSCEFKPISDKADAKAMEVTGLSLERLAVDGTEPGVAMTRFRDWVQKVAGDHGTPVFVGLNAPFDWSFVNYYFHRYLQANPFGFAALDIKALYMGATGCCWGDTRSSRMAAHLQPKSKGDHQALHDALYQAELFNLVRQLASRRDGH